MLSNLSKNLSSPEKLSQNTFEEFGFTLIPIGYLWVHIMVFNFMISLTIALKSEKTYLNMLYLSITLSDFLTGSICVTYEIFCHKDNMQFLNQLLCVVNKFSESSTPCLALSSLLMLIIHRYYRLTRPLDEKESMSRGRYAAIAFIWAFHFSLWIFYT
jgi:hypothetical protein